MDKTYPFGLQTITVMFNFLAGIFLLLLMMLTVADVLNRYFFGSSILGTVDISTLLLVGVAFLGLASAEVTGKHVTVTLIDDNSRLRTRTVFSWVRFVVLFVTAVVLLLGLAQSAFSAYGRGETTNAILLLPTWPAKVVLFLSFFVFLVAAIIKEWKELHILRGGRIPDEGELDVDSAGESGA